jgi:hypothetical protein
MTQKVNPIDPDSDQADSVRNEFDGNAGFTEIALV